jgi:peptidoglycan/LPS O-acetylase OafA/YrhL
MYYSVSEHTASSAGDVRPTSDARIPELDGLRGLAILLVILCHYFGNATHAPLGFLADHILTIVSLGWSGVDLFFVLSGFLIGGILLDARESPKYFKTFYLRRFFRIFPLYYSWITLYVIILSILTFVVHRPVSIPPEGLPITFHDFASVPHYVFFVQNIFYSPTRFEWIWFVVTWSLAVEEQFYLVAPPLVRFISRKALIAVLISCVVGAPILRYVAFTYCPNGDHFSQSAMPSRADALSLGILAAIAWRREPVQRFLSSNQALLQRIVIYLGLAIFALLWWLVRPPNIVTVTIGYSLLGWFYLSLLLLVLSQTSSVVARFMRMRWLRALGTISYCVYIIHLTVNQWAHRLILREEPRIYTFSGVLITLFALAFTLALASLSWKVFEKPLIRKGHRFSY